MPETMDRPQGQELAKIMTQDSLLMNPTKGSTSDLLQTEGDHVDFNYLTGWRLHVITGG